MDFLEKSQTKLLKETQGTPRGIPGEIPDGTSVGILCRFPHGHQEIIYETPVGIQGGTCE